MTTAILIKNEIQTKELANEILGGGLELPIPYPHPKIGVFSHTEVEKAIDAEHRHGLKILTPKQGQSLQSMSSGEQKKMLLSHLLNSKYEVLLLINPYDNLDIKTHHQLKSRFDGLSQKIDIIQILTRSSDILSTTEHFYSYNKGSLTKHGSKQDLFNQHATTERIDLGAIPPPKDDIPMTGETLVNFKNVDVSYHGKPVLNNITWLIKKNEFWQLKGPNGSGKSTLLNMITGDNHKGYGQDLTLFGQKKGSGESVWDIKELVGYFTPAMVDRCKGYHSLENMIISGLHDSVGLYQIPSETDKVLARQWLKLIGLHTKKEARFQQLSQGEKRLVMTARAMIKHPPLLILDEPTIGLDDVNAAFFVALVNSFAAMSRTTVLFVSHREEQGLRPQQLLELHPSENGSVGKITLVVS